MKRTIYFACLLATIVLLLPSVADAQTCFFVGTQPDGRILGPYFINSASNDISLAFTAEAGRSYVMEVMTSQGPSGGGSLSPAININTGFCPNSDVASGFAIRDVTSITPTCNSSCSGGLKRSIVVTGASANFLEMRIHNNSASTSAVVVAVTETTQFSPRWSTFAGFFTSYGFQNTTNAVIGGTLTLRSGTGSVVGTQNFVIQPGQVGFTDTIQMGVGANNAGSAVFVHDGPVGGITADGFIQNFSISPPVIQPVRFEPRTQPR